MAEKKHILDELLEVVAPDLAAAIAETSAPAPAASVEPDPAHPVSPPAPVPGYPAQGIAIGTPAIHRSEWKLRRAIERGEIKPST